MFFLFFGVSVGEGNGKFIINIFFFGGEGKVNCISKGSVRKHNRVQ